MESNKKHWTDEERLQLAEKLDKELDDYISGLEKKPYTEGWPEDRWEEEIEKHPFFMKKPPEPGDDLHPLYEGLQQLKYDPAENTPEELANSYKDDGNFNFKHKKYRMAIISYTEGLRIKCNNNELSANLLNNRASAHFYLKNYRSSLRDCESALKLKPDYEKVLIRAAKCAFELQQFEKCIQFCDHVNDNKEILELRQKAVRFAKIKERDARIAEKKLKQQNELLENIYVKSGKKFEMHELQPILPQLQGCAVHFNETKQLVWPVVFFYPEFKVMDSLQEFCEDDIFLDHLYNVFETPPEWDTKKEYKPENLNVYFKDDRNDKYVFVDVTNKLGDILCKKNFPIHNGTPSFLIVVKNSKTESDLLTQK